MFNSDMCKTSKNFCKSKDEPLSLCEYYDCKDETVCEYFEESNASRGRATINGKARCKYYFNGAVCKCQDAQEDNRK